MAITKQLIPLLNPVSIPAGGTKLAPNAAGVSAAVDCRGFYGGELAYKIINGNPAPGQALAVTFQASGDGVSWYDLQTFAGDAIVSSVFSNSFQLDVGVMYLRVLAWNNTTNPVTVEASLQAITGI